MGNGGRPVGEERPLSRQGGRQGEQEVRYERARYVPMQQLGLMQGQGGIYEDREYGPQQQVQGGEVEYEDEYEQPAQGNEVEGDSVVGSSQEVMAGVEVPITPPQTQGGPERMKELEGMIWSGALLGITAESLEQNQHGDEQQQQDHGQHAHKGEHQRDEQMMASI